MNRFELLDYRNKYPKSTWVIVGKGPNHFQFENLASVKGPVIFLNDAVQFERHATSSVETFFFAHDCRQAEWLKPDHGLKSTVVMATGATWDKQHERRMLSVDKDIPDGFTRPIVIYRWGGWHGETLQHHSSIEIAKSGKLHLHSGTIHTALHFAWVCGAQKIVFIGCDGHGATYDSRVDLKSQCPQHANDSVFRKIRMEQDRICKVLGLQTDYVSEPRIEAAIPKTLHFVWFGKRPAWVERNINEFRQMHPTWSLRLWTDAQVGAEEAPTQLKTAIADSILMCQKSDLFRYWLLYKYGGIYLDADTVAYRPLDSLLRYRAFVAKQHDGRVNCAAMGCEPGSPAIKQLLDKCLEISQVVQIARTAYGPSVLTELWGDREYFVEHADGLTMLPEHYFYLMPNCIPAKEFWDGDEVTRQALIDRFKESITDHRGPFSVHLWGVDGSSNIHAFGRGTALKHRIERHAYTIGVEVGVLAGRLSGYLLKHCPDLTLHLVDRWSEVSKDSTYFKSGDHAAKCTQAEMEENYQTTLEAVAFAGGRAVVHRGDSVEEAATFEDGSVDFVFLDDDHSLAGVRRSIAAWWPKIRSGGMLCGHDMDNPAGAGKGTAWGVRQAVEEFMIVAGLDPAMLELGGEYTWYVVKP